MSFHGEIRKNVKIVWLKKCTISGAMSLEKESFCIHGRRSHRLVSTYMQYDLGFHSLLTETLNAVDREGPDQTMMTCRMIWVFTVHIMNNANDMGWLGGSVRCTSD